MNYCAFKIGHGKIRWALSLAVVAGCLGTFAHTTSAGLASASGGSGYSGDLSSNLTIRHQELICDPANAPISGSTSVKYDPNVVDLSGLVFGPGYTGKGFVEEETRINNKTHFFLQSISSFLTNPKGTETGYVQVTYEHTAGTPGILSPINGYIPVDVAGVTGFDTHALIFTYEGNVPASTVAKYTIYADHGKRPSHNQADFLAGLGPNGKKFIVGPNHLSSATVSGSLLTAVPLPATVWGASALLLGLASATLIRKSARIPSHP